MLGAFGQDFRSGLRMLRQNPGFTIVAVLSLALGIGANTAIFTIINAVFLHPLPVEEPSKLVEVFTRDTKTVDANANFQFTYTSLPNYGDFRDQNTVFSGLAGAAYPVPIIWSGRREPQQVNAILASANYFDVLGVKAYRGRTFLPEEDKKRGGNFLVVLSYYLWSRNFGSDPGLIGRTITLNAMPYTVIGIAPPNFKGTISLGPPDILWVPISMRDYVYTVFSSALLNDRRFRWASVIGRLKPQTTIEQAESGLQTIASALEKEYPRENLGRTVVLFPLNQSALGINQRRQYTIASGLLMSVVGIVLLIACLNLANLLLAQAARREKELTLRAALGAGRARLVRQLLTESTMLSLLGGAAGLLVAFLGRKLLWSSRPPFLVDGSMDLSFDSRVLGFTMAISLLTGLLFGLLPAIKVSRAELNEILKASGRGGTLGGKHNRVRGLLVISEMALSVVALIGAGLFLRSLQRAQQLDPGFEAKNLFQLQFDLATLRYDSDRGQQFIRDLIERAKSVPGVVNASVSSDGIFAGTFRGAILREGEQVDPNNRGVFVQVDNVSPGHFETLHTRLVAGRDFNDFDREKALPVAMVNEATARLLWPGQEAVGRRFSLFASRTILYQIVGVVGDAFVFQVGEEPQPIAYFPIRQQYASAASLEVRTAGNPEAMIATVRNQVQQLDPNLAFTNVQTAGEILSQGLWTARMEAALLGLFGLLALVLASVGIYGVLAYSVTQRTAEVGIRMALGAQPREVLRLVLRQGMTLAAIGTVLGLVAGLLLARTTASLLYGVSATDPVIYVGITVLLLSVALLACYIPARRATRIDPVVALRFE